MRFKLAILSLLIFVGSTCMSQEDTYADKQLEVVLRTIGHQLLLEVGDTSSRVLPIEFENDQYYVSFESDFGFMPEILVSIADEVFAQFEIEEEYIIEVIQCNSKEVMYSFENAEMLPLDETACLTRELPVDCYQLVFEMFDPNEEAKIIPLVGELNEEEQSKTNLYKWIIGILTVTLLLIILLRRNRTEINTNPNRIKLGNYIFDKGSGKLILNDQQVELTGKENDLLSLLYQSANNTVKREEILNKVWGDEGDYVGRTLDVFVSKLRKKLELDESVKISNIRGVGYKLILEQP